MSKELHALVYSEDYGDMRKITEFLMDVKGYGKVEQIYDLGILEKEITGSIYNLYVLSDNGITEELTDKLRHGAKIIVYSRKEDDVLYVKGNIDFFFEMFEGNRI